MTEATRTALVDLAGNGFHAQLSEETVQAEPTPARSLIGTLGGMLIGRQRS